MAANRSARASWPATAATVPAARRFVREHLRGVGHDDLVDSAELIVSELVGNVVLHVGGNVVVEICVLDEQVVLEVTDDSPLSPQLRVFSRTSSTGRGMRLVHSLSTEHGVRATGEGKTIWVHLTSATAQRTEADLAADFADLDWLAELADLAVDGDGAGARAAA